MGLLHYIGILMDHPLVLPCQVKEPNYFSQNWRYRFKNKGKYWSLFPPKSGNAPVAVKWPELDKSGALFHEEISKKRQETLEYITGEASANSFYLANPKVVHRMLPGVKLILMLRNPVDRTFSHYRMLWRFKKEGRQVKALFGPEIDLTNEMEVARTGKKTDVIGPGIYIRQLPRWINTFGRENIFIIQTEDLNNPKEGTQVMADLCAFLDLPPHDFQSILQQKFNKAPTSDIPEELREELAFFLCSL